MSTEPAFLQIREIVKDFGGHKAVNHVSIDIAKGEIFALLGSSGCGKTTLLRMLAGFETPTSGSTAGPALKLNTRIGVSWNGLVPEGT